MSANIGANGFQQELGTFYELLQHPGHRQARRRHAGRLQHDEAPRARRCSPRRAERCRRSSAIRSRVQKGGTAPGRVQLAAKHLLLHKAAALGCKNRLKLEGNFVQKKLAVMRMRAGKQLEAELLLPDTASRASLIVFII